MEGLILDVRALVPEKVHHHLQVFLVLKNSESRAGGEGGMHIEGRGGGSEGCKDSFHVNTHFPRPVLVERPSGAEMVDGLQ